MAGFEEVLSNVPLKMKQFIPGYRYLKRFYSDSIFNKVDQDKAIRKLHNIHKGDRCFILGSGPSLNKTNLSLLANEIVFGCNTIYKLPIIHSKYYGVCDIIVWKKRYKKLLDLDTILFLSGSAARDYISHRDYYSKFQKKEPFLLRDLGEMNYYKRMSKDLTKGVYWGHTVIIDICIQVSYYLGFDKVYLLGCDSNYSLGGRFDGKPTDNLKGGGALGSWDEVFNTYNICKHAFEEDGREIVNATIGGKLEVFERKSLEEILI